MTYQEALVLIDRSPELKTRLEGKWFYLSGKGLKEFYHYTFDHEGKLMEGRGNLENTVYAYLGTKFLSLGVRPDDLAGVSGARFDICAGYARQGVASVVVGVPIDFKMEPHRITEALRT
jgi:hypothetical protein